jgi:hypothetical protein
MFTTLPDPAAHLLDLPPQPLGPVPAQLQETDEIDTDRRAA